MRRRYVAIAVLVSLLLLGSVAAVPGGRALVVADAETGEQYMTVPVEDGTTVALEYMHSVEKTRVYDEYTVRGDHLEMTRMEFESYGWGLPSRSDVREVNGTFVLADPDWQGREINVKPGRIADHHLIVDGHDYDLVERSNARAVTIRVTDRSLLATLLHS